MTVKDLETADAQLFEEFVRDVYESFRGEGTWTGITSTQRSAARHDLRKALRKLEAQGWELDRSRARQSLRA